MAKWRERRAVGRVGDGGTGVKRDASCTGDDFGATGTESVCTACAWHLYHETSSQQTPLPNLPPSPPSLSSKVEPIVVDGDLAVCEGGGGALGHPVEYITLKPSGSKLAGICKYCNLRYVSSGH